MDNRKKVYIGIGAIAIIVLVLGVSFALWNINIAQEGINKLETDCFKIEFTDKNAISLSNAYPIEDELGMMQTPYTFTIKNICNIAASYQINLETMNPSGTKMPDKYLKVNLSEGSISKKTTKLDKSINGSLDTEITITDAVDAYKLTKGILKAGETKEFNLRIWMDSEVLASDEDSMNANYQGKISIIASATKVDNRGTMMARDDNYAFWQDEYARLISNVVIESVMTPKETELSWDISETKDGSVMSYLMFNEDNTIYTLYIQGNERVKANSNSSNLFYRFYKLESIEGLEYFDTSNVTDMSDMFWDCNSLTNLDLSNFDTSNVTDMSSMFQDCNSLINLDLSNFDTSNVIDVYRMFAACYVLINLDLSSFNTSNVTNMSDMFSNCNSLTSLDLSSLDTSNVTNMSGMFSACISLASLDLSSFNTSNVTDMSRMFSYCRSLTSLDLSSLDTSNVTNISGMFSDCSSLTSLDLSNFDTSNVTDMSWMFYSCSSLTNLDLSSFNANNVTIKSNMFSDMPTTAIIYVKDATIQNWILTSDNDYPDAWTTENVIIKA